MFYLRIADEALAHFRSGGDRGATVDLLRGTKGADFEAPGLVRLEGEAVSCGCWGGGSSEDFKSRYIVIKGPFCFVFQNETASSPSYAIRLHHMSSERDKGSRVVTLRESIRTDAHFMITLDSEDKAAELHRTIRRMTAEAETEDIRKRLGHGHLLNKRSSVRFAEAVATQKTQDQPEVPVTTTEMLATINLSTDPYGL
uniref:Uncharacterized protein n=1 Tax=Amphora coffeiformis TaxID=265554 RepID=A0A7S3P793_9STRA|eukprot:scaffold4425_cov168-Amphora_coffeaeformis.AAC.13